MATTMKDSWLERRGERFARYRLHTIDSDLLYLGDGQYTRTFALYKYWGEDNNWKPWGDSNTPIYVTVESLLSEFILIDGVYAVANNGKDVAPIGKSTDMDEQIKQENERHTEDIHTLHSGESETDPERPTE